MNVKYLIPFVEAAYEVLLAEANYKLQRGELTLEKGPYVVNDITVIISMVGDIKGSVFYNLSKSTALVVVSAMLGENINDFNSLAQSGVAELGNVITGRASVKLSQNGFQSTISPPALILGKGAIISTLDMPRLVVPLMGEHGPITIHLAIRENAPTGMTAAQMAVPSAPEPP